MNIKYLSLSAGILLSMQLGYAQRTQFNKNWTFNREGEAKEQVSLPHTTRLEPKLVNDQWQGLAYYYKDFDVENFSKDKCYFIEFEAAMNKVNIWLNGKLVKTDQGGFLPTIFDATPHLKAKGNVIKVEVDNRDNATTGPKPIEFLDFNMYGGLYRNAWIREANKVHISDASFADEVAGGGIFITYPKVNKQQSTVSVKTHVVNKEKKAKNVEVIQYVMNGDKTIAKSSAVVKIPANSASYDTQVISLDNPKLWSPDTPNLYTLKTEVKVDGKEMDTKDTRFGIREFTFVDNQIHINGKKTYLRGVNRHQEYPFVGYALSDNAQYRDAHKIKSAGFDLVRLSHYPHSTSFMEACDELGLVVLDAVMGWQYYPNEAGKKFYPNITEETTKAFDAHLQSQARRLVRRDRNHACVLAWEVSLNETDMPIPFMDMMHKTVKEEFPYGDAFTCGWKPEVYDIYLQARQHRIMHSDAMTFEKPYIVSEYGDWEYYSNNAGLNQHNLEKGKRYEASSRQCRTYGEKRLLQQAYNLQEAYNDNMNIPATGDGYWVMYDYNRGYHDDIEFSGIMDIFRLPKLSDKLYASQRDMKNPKHCILDIASYWTAESATDVTVYSNAEEVALYLNGKLVARQKPDNNKNTTNLNNPPFTFKVGTFVPGELRAEAFDKNGKVIKEDIVKTPNEVSGLKVWVDKSGREPQAGCNDVVFVYIAGVDKDGTINPSFTETIDVTLEPGWELMNVDPVKAEAGIATAVIRIGDDKGVLSLKALSESKLKRMYKLKVN